MRLLTLAAVFVGAGFYYTLLWWPITLQPFWAVFRNGLPLACLLMLAPLVDLALRPRIGPVLRFPSSILGASALGVILTILFVSAQLVLIERKPYLSLSQYLREEIWIIWIVSLPISLWISLFLATWERLAARATSLSES